MKRTTVFLAVIALGTGFLGISCKTDHQKLPTPTAITTFTVGKLPPGLPQIVTFKAGDTVVSDDILLFTGLRIKTGGQPCALSPAPSGGMAISQQGVLVGTRIESQTRAFLKCNLQRGEYIEYGRFTSVGTNQVYPVARFQQGQRVFGMVVLQDGTTFPVPCQIKAAPQDGTVHFGQGVPSIGIITTVNGVEMILIQAVSPGPPGTGFNPQDLPACSK